MDQLRYSWRAGELDRAEKIARDLADSHSDYWGAQHTLGLVCFDKRDFAAAFDRLSRAVLLNPENPLTLSMLARTCIELDNAVLAQLWLERAMLLACENAHVLFAKGEFHRAEDEHEQAAEAYSRVLLVDENHIQARTALGASLVDLGRHAEAVADLEPLLALQSLEPLHVLAALPAGATRVDILAELDSLAPSLPHRRVDDEISVAFMRARCLHNSGRHADAWAQLIEANRLALSGREGELEERKTYESATLEMTRSAVQRYRPRVADSERPASLFILGPSRSGKTTLEHLVATIGGVRTGFESRLLGNVVCASFQDAGLLPSNSLELLPLELHEGLRERYFHALSRKYGSARVVTNTTPGLIADAARIAAVIPNV